jgi:hypothetical protein
MKDIAASLTDPHVSERCAQHRYCRKGSGQTALITADEATAARLVQQWWSEWDYATD